MWKRPSPTTQDPPQVITSIPITSPGHQNTKATITIVLSTITATTTSGLHVTNKGTTIGPSTTNKITMAISGLHVTNQMVNTRSGPLEIHNRTTNNRMRKPGMV